MTSHILVKSHPVLTMSNWLLTSCTTRLPDHPQTRGNKLFPNPTVPNSSLNFVTQALLSAMRCFTVLGTLSLVPRGRSSTSIASTLPSYISSSYLFLWLGSRPSSRILHTLDDLAFYFESRSRCGGTSGTNWAQRDWWREVTYPPHVRIRIEKLSRGGAKLTPNKWSEIGTNVDLWRIHPILFNIEYV